MMKWAITVEYVFPVSSPHSPKKKKDPTEFLEVLKNQSWGFSRMEIKTGRRKQSEIQTVYATPSLYNNISFLVMSSNVWFCLCQNLPPCNLLSFLIIKFGPDEGG